MQGRFISPPTGHYMLKTLPIDHKPLENRTTAIYGHLFFVEMQVMNVFVIHYMQL